MKRPVFNLCTLFLFFIALASCSKQNLPSANNSTTPAMPASADSLHYLALGDSYTIGQNVMAAERFPHLAVSLLRAQNISFADPKYIATTGWTTANLLAAINNENVLGTYDIVSLLIGVNDQYQRQDTAGYRTHFKQLLDKSLALAGNRSSRVFVLSIPDYSATPFVADREKSRVHNEINLFNAINKEITLGYGIKYIDITPLTREAATDGSLLADDQLHYSGKEHQMWAGLLAPAIKSSLP